MNKLNRNFLITIFSIIVIFLVLISVYFIWYRERPEEVKVPEKFPEVVIPPNVTKITDEDSLLLAEQYWTNQQLYDYYHQVEEKDLNQLATDIKQKIDSRVYKYSYDYDPNSDQNSDLVVQTMSVDEQNVVDIYSHDTLYFNCMALTTRNPNYCSKIRDDGYFKVQCIETLYLISALEKKNSELCFNIGTEKIGVYCKAFIEGDLSICEAHDFENIMFEKTCVALANKDFETCKNYECNFPYYYISALYAGDSSKCKNIYSFADRSVLVSSDQGDEDYCINVVEKNVEFCNQYLPSRLIS